MFFFSSRRRHTRFTSDWSSDVCSSDLHHKSNRSKTSWTPPTVMPSSLVLDNFHIMTMNPIPRPAGNRINDQIGTPYRASLVTAANRSHSTRLVVVTQSACSTDHTTTKRLKSKRTAATQPSLGRKVWANLSIPSRTTLELNLSATAFVEPLGSKAIIDVHRLELSLYVVSL